MKTNRITSKAISVIMVFLMIFCSFNVIAAEREVVASGSFSNITWTLYSDGELDISGSGEISQAPWRSHLSSIESVNISQGITSINSSSFSGCENLKTVVLPDGMEEIGSWVFHKCSSLKEIVIPETVIRIGSYAFYQCAALENISIPDGVKTLDTGCFKSCGKLTRVDVSDTVTVIGEEAFSYCENLTNITFGDNVEAIGQKAFYNCSNMESIIIPPNVKSIGNDVFHNCKKLTIYGFSGSYAETYANTNGIAFYASIPYDFILPDSVTMIADEAFAGCSASSVKLSENVSSIGNRAFADCVSLIRIEIPVSVTHISGTAFENTPNITILCSEGSTAYDYACANGIPYIAQ